MSTASGRPLGMAGDPPPSELRELSDRVKAQRPEVRAELEPLVEEALESAWFRGRVLVIARDALEQLRLDLELTRFDLDATRREREGLLKQMRERPGGSPRREGGAAP